MERINRGFNIKIIKKYYYAKLEDKNGIKLKVEQIFYSTEDDFLKFILHVLFYDTININVRFNYLYGLFYYKGWKIIKFLIKRILNLEVEEISLKVDHETNSYRLLEFLLIIEKKYKYIFLEDQNFFNNLIIKLSEEEIQDILCYKSKISLITLELLKNIDEFHSNSLFSDFFQLFKAEKMTKEEGIKKLESLNFNLKRITKYLLKTTNKSIKPYYKVLIDFFPEKLTFHEKVVPNRITLLKNPMENLIYGKINDYKTIRTYIKASIIYHKDHLKNIQISDTHFNNLEILLKLNFLEDFLRKDLNINERIRVYKKILHPFILESPMLVSVIVKRGFPIKYIKEIVDNVSSFHLAYVVSLKKLESNLESEFYQKLTEELLKKYPVISNIKKFENIKDLLPNEYSQRVLNLFESDNKG